MVDYASEIKKMKEKCRLLDEEIKVLSAEESEYNQLLASLKAKEDKLAEMKKKAQ